MGTQSCEICCYQRYSSNPWLILVEWDPQLWKHSDSVPHMSALFLGVRHLRPRSVMRLTNKDEAGVKSSDHVPCNWLPSHEGPAFVLIVTGRKVAFRDQSIALAEGCMLGSSAVCDVMP